MSFHPVEAISGAIVIPALVFLIPIHVAALGLVLAIMTVMGVGSHLGWEMFPRALVHGPAGRRRITTTHPEQHHAASRGDVVHLFPSCAQGLQTERRPHG